MSAPSARADAREACAHALGLFLRGAGDPHPVLDQALASDPDGVPALLLRAGLAIASKERAALGLLDTTLARLAQLGERLDERERGHVAAAYAWRAGSHRHAAALYAEVVRRSPHDLLALRLAQSCCFMLGDAHGMHDAAAGALPHWHAGMPGYDCTLAMYGFGLEEIGDWARAAAVGRRALEIEPGNAVAVHVVAHALASAGDPRAGVDWMARHEPCWRNGGAMASHNGWHLALFHLALGATGRALALCDALVVPAAGRSATDAADAAALLWHLELLGVDVGARWPGVTQAFAVRGMPALWPLVDVHAALAFAAAGRAREIDRLQGALARGGPVAREVALPVARALAAFAAGDHAECAATLAAHRHDAWRLGGSRLQREILQLTLGEAAARAGGRRTPRLAAAA